jgi:hypothetical protein
MIESIARVMFDARRTRFLSQGSIFNYAYHEDYMEEEVLGVVITARCDISNSKAEKYSFLPVIPLRKWIKVELKSILERRYSKSIKNAALQDLKSLGFSENLIDMYGFERVKDQLKLSIPHKKKLVEKALISIERYNCLEDKVLFYKNISFFDKEVNLIIRDIIENKIMDYFFIDCVGEYGSCIVNLRDVGVLDKIFANKIQDGIEVCMLTEEEKKLCRSVTMFDSDALVSLVGEINSPYIELLMQRFSDNFVRIGVDNPHVDLANEVCSSLGEIL